LSWIPATALLAFFISLPFLHFVLVEEIGSANITLEEQEEGIKMENGNLTSIPPPASLKPLINIPEKLLMGPGPANISPRVMQACGLPVIGHMHKEFFQVMDDIKAGVQYVFQTNNPWTITISGPGHLGMEAALVNIVEPGDTVLVGVNGLWGNRAGDLANRLGANVKTVETTGGKSLTKSEIAQALQTHRPQVLFLVHSESSTGVVQNLEGIGELCESYNCLLVVDTVASLGGVPFYADKWKVDVVYTGSQKVLGAPPGLSPISFGPRAVAKIKSRTTPIKSFVLDMNHLANYWDCNGDGQPRGYHHTPPVNLYFALREALAQVAAEKLENLWARHAECAQRLYAGLKGMGLQLFVENPADRLPTVTTIVVPQGTDWKHVTQYAMDKYLIEIAGGLGATAGKVWRIGIMGYNAYPGKVDRVLQALREGVEYAKLHGRF